MWGDNECEPNVTDFVIRPVWYLTIQNTIPNTKYYIIPNTIPYQIPYHTKYHVPNTIPYQILYYTLPNILPRSTQGSTQLDRPSSKHLERDLKVSDYRLVVLGCYKEVWICLATEWLQSTVHWYLVKWPSLETTVRQTVVTRWRGQISPQQVFAWWHDITWEGFGCRGSPHCG